MKKILVLFLTVFFNISVSEAQMKELLFEQTVNEVINAYIQKDNARFN